MNYGSVCSGIEAATVAWHTLGWKPAFFSEIEKFPRQVLAHYYPKVPLHGDFTTIKGDEYESINLLVGGTPCQSFSVAGLRKGLDDPRGNLMLEFGSLARRLGPKWLVWENVPGVLSANGGGDFGTFLGMLAELGYGFAYRVLDAQYFGVPQRRRRVFVVGCLGDWRSAAAVLFERHSLSGNIAPSRQARQEVAGGVELGPGGGRFTDLNPTLDTRAQNGPIRNQLAGAVLQPVITMDHGQGGAEIGFDSGPTLTCNHEAPIAAYGIPGNWIGRKPENGGNAVEPMHDVAPCLTKTDQHGVAHCYIPDQPHVLTAMQVRRLTPVECERLQGFPDNYTNIAVKTPDGPRYKALGNSMAVPVMRWIGERIQTIEDLNK